MSRLKLGDTRLTHGFQLKGEDFPYCYYMTCLLLPDDILIIECADLFQTKERSFKKASVRFYLIM